MKRLSLEVRLRRAKDKASKYALRDPRTKQDIINRRKWDRLNDILWRRYDNKLHHPSQPDMPRMSR
jgi:hypothetical protein